jgi:hypothetical protein
MTDGFIVATCECRCPSPFLRRKFEHSGEICTAHTPLASSWSIAAECN